MAKFIKTPIAYKKPREKAVKPKKTAKPVEKEVVKTTAATAAPVKPVKSQPVKPATPVKVAEPVKTTKPVNQVTKVEPVKTEVRTADNKKTEIEPFTAYYPARSKKTEQATAAAQPVKTAASPVQTAKQTQTTTKTSESVKESTSAVKTDTITPFNDYYPARSKKTEQATAATQPEKTAASPVQAAKQTQTTTKTSKSVKDNTSAVKTDTITPFNDYYPARSKKTEQPQKSDAAFDDKKSETTATTNQKPAEHKVVETQKSDDDNSDNILVVKNLKKYFTISKDFFGRPTRFLRAVDDVSFTVKRGRTIGIVGESGCGKTTMGRSILRLHEITGGKVIFDGVDVGSLRPKEMRAMRPHMQIIFQDPYSSLSPRLPVGEIIGEAVRTHKLVKKSEYRDYIISVMRKCGLQPHYFDRYPHEFSGGQRQRICIARALALKPKMVICDEPVSALDVSIQAQIINLLEDLQNDLGLTYVFISHDLSVVEHISDDVGVMYLGNIVEKADKRAIFNNPMHPYTEALFSAVPVPDPNVKMNRIILKGDIPSPANPPKGCKFHTRCPKAMDVCKEIPPKFLDYGDGHFVACHLYPQE